MFRYCIFCICIFQLATVVNSYTLLNRVQHTASYVDNKIYFLGGSTNEKTYTNDFFYLDVSKPFTLDSDLPIVDLSGKTSIPNHAMATSSVCGSNKDTIFLLGGIFEDDTAPLVFAFNTSNPVWTVVNDKGSKPIRRALSTGVCNENAKIYSFGGVNGGIVRNDFDIFDTNQFIWSAGNNLNTPPPMDTIAATLLPDGRIVYLGGATYPGGVNTGEQKLISMTEIYIYDINNDKWSTMITNGASPEARAAHTTVLTQDGRIIVYGGNLLGGIPAPEPLLVLDTTVQPFKWSIPNVSFMPSFAPSWRHTATLVGNYMIVAFGFVYTNKASVASNKIHILDVSDKDNYKWVTKFTPVASPVSTTVSVVSPTSDTKDAASATTNLGAIIGGTIGGIVVMVVGITLIYRRNSRIKAIPTPGESKM